MRIVIFHYHLNPGGVTRIVESQVEALKALNPEQEIVIITGDCKNDAVFRKYGVELIINPDLNYLPEAVDLEERLEQIDIFLDKSLYSDDILHFHNLNLGKNPLLTLLISHRATNGSMVINHAHDFAEDRPANQKHLKDIIEGHFGKKLNEVLYPKVNNYRFVTLNSFDLNRLISYGINPYQCDMLANPVVFNSKEPDGNAELWRNEVVKDLKLSTDKLVITYPVRVIRRKNIAEFVLLAVLFADKANWVVTQPPQNPIEQEHYFTWKEFCKKEQIKIFWEAGNNTDFEKLIRSSDFCISTSIQEGFGMVFMEPWLLNTAVIGRNIQMVTKDMVDSGMTFPGLYNRFELGNQKELHEFDIADQMSFVKSVWNNKDEKEELIKKNLWIKNLLIPPTKELIEKNKSVILNKFSLRNYGELLNEVYRRIIK